MSLAVLRKKTLNHNSRTAPLSANGIFALNGTTRRHTYIGQHNLGSYNNCSSSSSNVINKSVQSSKALLTPRCNRGRICYKPAYTDISGNRTYQEYLENLSSQCYTRPDSISSNSNMHNCFTKNSSVSVNTNKNRSYSNFIKIKTLQCSTVKTGPKLNINVLPYVDYLKELKIDRKKCI